MSSLTGSGGKSATGELKKTYVASENQKSGKKMQLHGKIINIAISREKVLVRWHDQSVSTGIFKEPVQSTVQIQQLGIVGDQQADLSVHGGLDKAVYAYPSEHYAYWKEELAGRNLDWGMFGENLTTIGLNEENVCIGDEFRVGTARLRVTQPRTPCYKLGIRFGDDAMVKRFFKSGKWGIYFAVVEEGTCQTGDEIVYLSSDEHNVKVIDVVQLLLAREVDDMQLSRVLDSNLAMQMKMALMQRFGS